MNLRKPTEEEKAQLIQYLFEQENIVKPTEEDKVDKAGLIDNSAIAVFDDYTTDSPGYQGKVMAVIWPGSPGLTETFIWHEGKIEHCPNET